MPEIIHIKIAGIFNYPEGKGVLKNLVAGQAVILQREPQNTHDPNAIAVFGNSENGPIKIGYVPRLVALKLKEVNILGAYKGVSWDEIRIETP